MGTLRVTATKDQTQILLNFSSGSAVTLSLIGDYHDFDFNDLLTLDDGDDVMTSMLTARDEGDVTIKDGAVTLVESGAGAGEIDVADLAALKAYLESATVAEATVDSPILYVDGTNGDDAFDGKEGTPLKTITAALAAALALETADPTLTVTLMLEPGDYTGEDLDFSVGAALQRIAVEARVPRTALVGSILAIDDDADGLKLVVLRGLTQPTGAYETTFSTTNDVDVYTEGLHIENCSLNPTNNAWFGQAGILRISNTDMGNYRIINCGNGRLENVYCAGTAQTNTYEWNETSEGKPPAITASVIRLVDVQSPSRIQGEHSNGGTVTMDVYLEGSTSLHTNKTGAASFTSDIANGCHFHVGVGCSILSPSGATLGANCELELAESAEVPALVDWTLDAAAILTLPDPGLTHVYVSQQHGHDSFNGHKNYPVADMIRAFELVDALNAADSTIPVHIEVGPNDNDTDYEYVDMDGEGFADLANFVVNAVRGSVRWEGGEKYSDLDGSVRFEFNGLIVTSAGFLGFGGDTAGTALSDGLYFNDCILEASSEAWAIQGISEWRNCEFEGDATPYAEYDNDVRYIGCSNNDNMQHWWEWNAASSATGITDQTVRIENCAFYGEYQAHKNGADAGALDVEVRNSLLDSDDGGLGLFLSRGGGASGSCNVTLFPGSGVKLSQRVHVNANQVNAGCTRTALKGAVLDDAGVTPVTNAGTLIDDNAKKVVVASVDLKDGASDFSAPVPHSVDFNFVPTRAVVRCRTATALAGDTSISIGTSAGGTQILASTPLTGLDAADETFLLDSLVAAISKIAGQATIYVKVTSVDTGTSGTADVELHGDQVAA